MRQAFLIKQSLFHLHLSQLRLRLRHCNAQIDGTAIHINQFNFHGRSNFKTKTLLVCLPCLMNFFVQLVLKFMTAGEDKFDNCEQLYQEKFLVLFGASFRSFLCPTSFRADHNKQLMVEAKYDSYNNNNDNLFQFIIY